MALQSTFPGFSCPECGAASIVIEGALTPVTPVKCARCGTELGELDVFIDELERRLRARAQSTGGEGYENRWCA